MKKLSKYKNLKVLVTGSTGFKGSWLCLWLESLGAKVLGVALKPEKGSILFKSLKLEKKINQFYIDINDNKKIKAIIKKEKPDIVFHLAAQSIVSESLVNPLETIKTNVLGSASILDAFNNSNIKTLIYCTSDKCYENNEWIWSYRENDILGGKDPYSVSKACAELIFKTYLESFLLNNKNKRMGSVRAGNVIGGGDFKKERLIPDIFKAIFNNKKLIIKNINSVRPWQHVLDPLYGYLILGINLLEKNKFDIPNWNFGPNVEKFYSVGLIISKIEKFLNMKINKSVSNVKNIESKLLLINNDKAKLELNWHPKLNIDESLKYTCEWYSAYNTNKNKADEITYKQIEDYEKLI